MPKEQESLDPQMIELLEEVLATETKELEKDERVYLSSLRYGSSRYHIVDRNFDDILIEQIESSEKWSKRLILSKDELPALVRTLLSWMLADRELQKHQAQALDDHPF